MAFTTLLDDPLRDVTRKERRYLLVSATLGVFVSRAGILPTKITSLGVDFSTGDTVMLLKTLFGIITYFIVAFTIYGLSDILTWRFRCSSALRELRHLAQATKSPLSDGEIVYPPKFQLNIPLMILAADCRFRAYKYKRFRKTGGVGRFTRMLSFARLVLEIIVPLGVAAYALTGLWKRI